jgi:hypothetical protein
LRALAVVNPYAPQLTFVDTQTRARRDHEKYLGLIDTIALLHQHQRKVKRVEHHGKALSYIEVEPSDIAAANRIAHEVLGRTLDELPPQTRRLLLLIERLVAAGCEAQGVDREDFRFSRRAVREHTGIGQTQLRVHLSRLVDMEYLLVHAGMRGSRFVYELGYPTESAAGMRLPNLIEVEKLGYDTKLAGSGSKLAGRYRGDGGRLAGSLDGVQLSEESDLSAKVGGVEQECSTREVPRSALSYTDGGRRSVAAKVAG